MDPSFFKTGTIREAHSKGKGLARQSKPSTEPSIATNDSNVRDEEVTPVHPKQRYMKSASGDGDAPLVKKQWKSKT